MMQEILFIVTFMFGTIQLLSNTYLFRTTFLNVTGNNFVMFIWILTHWLALAYQVYWWKQFLL